ncbi:MAG TPA: glycine--tRNA ligase subunit alpha [bacterium]|nr:glycine--tRNA ligase subunit alpha [bacterium]HEX67945.1 glycine--tRNA ligase subunit alpha [bacterium]
MYFQEIILTLQRYWADKGCLIGQPTSEEVGAGTFNPLTFFGVLREGEWKVAYVEPSRRPTDGRYGENPNRLFQHYQFQVVIKPSPPDIQQVYLRSLSALGIEIEKHDIRFVEDDWQSPSLGAFGVGWEVWIDGMEITQFTYFQQMAGRELKSIPVEITYGLERIGMFLQGKDNVFDLEWAPGLKYGDLHKRDEFEFSKFSFEEADTQLHREWFREYEKEGWRLVEKGLALPAYQFVLKMSHTFNLLDARRTISPTERVNYIKRIRKLAEKCAEIYLGDGNGKKDGGKD